MKKILLLSMALLIAGCKPVDDGIESNSNSNISSDIFVKAWSEEQTSQILDKTMRLNFAFNDTQMSANEKEAVKKLLLAGERLHSIYMQQLHPQSRAVEQALIENDRQDLRDLFRIMKGPIATTLENERKAFVDVKQEVQERNIYPAGTTKESLDAYLDKNPDQKKYILDLRSVVKAVNSDNVSTALATLDKYPTLERLHPNVRDYIINADEYFALPYSIAYADDIFFVYDQLQAAAKLIEDEDDSFARYLRLRARDLLADNYDGSDAAWVTGQFTGNINAQIGSYETYDDALYGVKSFFSLSLLQRDIPKSNELSAAIGDIQSIEDILPYDARKKVRSNIPVGVYNVIADFGQARGTNTATILPNEGHLSRQYGRTILIRSNVLRNEQIFAEALKSFKSVTTSSHHNDLQSEGNFYRTLWHEIGHYLGPDQTKAGSDIDAALQNTADMMEEMKSDLVSLFAAKRLHQRGSYNDNELRSIYASGILRTLRKNKPRREQAYATMQLIQFNYFLDKGLLEYANGKLKINYARYDEVITSLLKEILDIQYQGDFNNSDKFVDRWTAWDESLHGVLANAMKAAEGSRYRLVTYQALGEK